jgi:hypothetical protein
MADALPITLKFFSSIRHEQNISYVVDKLYRNPKQLGMHIELSRREESWLRICMYALVD